MSKRDERLSNLVDKDDVLIIKIFKDFPNILICNDSSLMQSFIVVVTKIYMELLEQHHHIIAGSQVGVRFSLWLR